MERSEHYEFERIAEGVTSGIARPTGTALANTGIVDLGGSSLVFDTSLTLRSAREIVAELHARSAPGPILVANSHRHLDHILGNQLFASGPIYATRTTIDVLKGRQALLEAEITREKLAAEVADYTRRLAEATTEYARREYSEVLRLDGAILDESEERRITLPTEGFDSLLELPGDRGARLLSFGAGHTESDAVLFLPTDRLLFAGDLVVNRHHPNLTSGDPEHWLTVLDEIERLRPDRIVPGHGAVGDAEMIGPMRSYIQALLERSGGSGSGSIPPAFRDWVGPEQFTANLDFLRSRARGVG